MDETSAHETQQKPSQRTWWRRATFLDLMFPTLTIVFGLQMLRVLIPSVVLYKHAGSRAQEFGVFLFAPFVLALFAPLLPRVFGFRGALLVSALSAGLMRLGLQFTSDANVRLWLAAVGVLAFLMFVPISLGYTRGRKQVPDFGIVFLLALTFDTALHGLWGTYDYAWRFDVISVGMAMSLMLAQLLLLIRFLRTHKPATRTDRPLSAALPLFAIGMLLFFETLVFQNIARVGVFADVTIQMALLGLMIGKLVALEARIHDPVRNTGIGERRVIGAFFIVVVLIIFLQNFGINHIDISKSIVFGFFAFTFVFVIEDDDSRSKGHPGLWRTSTGWGLGMIGFFILLVLYYMAYDTELFFENSLLFLVAAVPIGVVTILSFRVVRTKSNAPIDRTPITLVAALFAGVFIYAIVSLTYFEVDLNAKSSVRILSYNIHMGFDGQGFLDLEAIAQTIEASGADIVALQEVPRGWYINGSVDALDWLSRRLSMGYVFGGAADALWGNAILTRFYFGDLPINPTSLRVGGVSLLPLPEGGVRPRRSLLRVPIGIGRGSLTVLVTHLHHADADVRLLQVPTVLDAGDVRRRLVILGDLNATPDSDEIGLLRDAGLRDAFELLGSGEGFTFRADDPKKRIDYIWLSPDLNATDFEIIDSLASDHLAIAVTIDLIDE